MKDAKDIRQEPAYQDLVKFLDGMSEERREALGALLEDEVKKDFMTTSEAAEKLSVQPVTVRSWLTKGKLKGRRLGGRWRVNKKDVEMMLNDSWNNN